MCRTENERSWNDLYLIVRKNIEPDIKSYRNNIKNELSEFDKDLSSMIHDLDVYNIDDFRKIIQAASEFDIQIYQLTRL